MIYLIRHGLDDERYIGGWSDIDLVQEGYKQIEDATQYIMDNKLVISKIISSDIIRARTTSNIINNRVNIDIEYSDELRELDKGDYTGLLKDKLSKEELERINKFSINDKYPRGEAMIDLYRRMKIYLDKLKSVDNILIVTHRGVINMLYYLLLDIDLDMDKEKFGVTHASIHEMDIQKKVIRRIY